MTSQPFTYRNPIWRLIRVFLILAAVFTAAGVPALLATIHLNAPATRDGTAAALCLLVTALALPGAGAMLLSALLTIPNALKADRYFAAFRQHDCLADWTYSDDEWRRYIMAEEARLRKVGWTLFCFPGLLIAVMGAVIGWEGSPTPHARLTGVSAGTAIGLAAAGLILACNRLYIVTLRRRLMSCPRAFVGRNAIFCGGNFAFWGSNMLALRSARLLTGHPPQLEFIIGTGGMGRNIGRIVDVVNAAGGRPTAVSRITYRYTVPVPDGRMAEAQTALRTILEPPPAAAVAAKAPAVSPVIPAAPTHHAPLPTRVAPQDVPATRAVKSRRSGGAWWWTTAALLLAGLVLIVTGTAFTGGLQTATVLAGMLLWCAAPVTLIVATVLTIRRRRARPMAR